MQKSKIDWPYKPLYVWNPLIGCKNGCVYCYAKRMNNRFKWIPDWTNPVFFPDRLQEPINHKKPSYMFVGSICDLFGNWIDESLIKQVLAVCEACPQHTFMFLTKNPRRYLMFDYPDNVMLGMTLTNEYDYDKHYKTMLLLGQFKTFVSLEPILGSFEHCSLAFDLVIIGAMTGPNPVIPQREWIENIYHPNIYYKNNILKYFPDLKN